MNTTTTLNRSSGLRLSSPENPASRFYLNTANERSRFTAHRAPTLISRPRLEDGLWRPLRLDLLKAPLTRLRD